MRRISATGIVDTLAGVPSFDDGSAAARFGRLAGPPDLADGPGSISRFNVASGLALDGGRTLLVADTQNHAIRYIDLVSGVVSTLTGGSGAGDTDGASGAARFRDPSAVAVDRRGHIFVADSGNCKIREI